jgi:hypothetical protein
MSGEADDGVMVSARRSRKSRCLVRHRWRFTRYIRDVTDRVM